MKAIFSPNKQDKIVFYEMLGSYLGREKAYFHETFVTIGKNTFYFSSVTFKIELNTEIMLNTQYDWDKNFIHFVTHFQGTTLSNSLFKNRFKSEYYNIRKFIW